MSFEDPLRLVALLGVLAVVAWNMAEKAEFWALVRGSRADAAIVLVTFLLVVFRDLTEGIIAGAAIGGAVFIRRRSEAAQAEPVAEAPMAEQSGDVVVYRLRGAYFFGAAATLGSVLDRIADSPRAFVVDFTQVPFVDSSGARSFELLARKMHRRGGVLVLTGANPEVRRTLLAHGLREPHVAWRGTVADALAEFPAQAEIRRD